MRLPRLAPALALALALAGCSGGGQPDYSATGPEPQKGGSMLALPDDAGIVEVAVEPVGGPKDKRVVAYFRTKDGSAALSPAPTDVTFTDEQGKTYPLVARPGDGPNAARFESGTAVNMAVGEAAGKLDAKIGDRPVTLESRPR